MSNTPKLIQCYNKGCSQLYDPQKNHSEACTFHPGEPFFHDAYKGWACCKKKCTDFTEFLNIKGCTKSFHSNVKPVEPKKPKEDKNQNEKTIEYRAPVPKIADRLPRPSETEPMIKLPSTTAGSLDAYLEKLKLDPVKQESTNQEKRIIVGTSCKNSGCRKTYEGEESNQETCVYHSGIPIFHEGLKYWTCCLKKTTDFNSFLEQIGCTNGKHIWIKQESSHKKSDCRYDWHQTGSHVFLSIYTKGVIPDKCVIEANAVKLKLYIESADGFIYDNEFILFGIINVENSLVTMSATKVEIKLKKAEPLSWQKLNIIETAPPSC